LTQIIIWAICYSWSIWYDILVFWSG